MEKWTIEKSTQEIVEFLKNDKQFMSFYHRHETEENIIELLANSRRMNYITSQYVRDVIDTAKIRTQGMNTWATDIETRKNLAKLAIKN